MDETDETMKPSSKNTSESISGIFKDFTCRVCLYRHEDNLEISDHLDTFVEYISKHLCFQVGSEDKFPMWICKFCQQSLQSFHKFYVKVSQIQESFTNLISVLKESPRKLDESPTLDAEFDAIDLTIGFHRGKSQQSVKKLKEISPRTISTRSSSKMAKSPIYSKNCTLDLSKKKNEKELQKIVEIDNSHPCEGNDDVLNYQSGIENNSVSNTQDSKDSKELIMLETAGSSEIPSKRGKSNKDDDLSSLEDQDWVGQGLTFDIGSDDSADDTWKPAGKSKRKIGSEDFCSDDTWKPAVKSRRKKSDEQSVEDTSNQLETCDDDKDISDEDVDAVNPKAKKSKLKITATHGTGPKPKLTPEVKRIMREEINAKFVEFYGISCDICVKDVRENSLPIEPAKFDSFVALCDHMKAEHNVRGYVKCCNCTMRDKKRAERHMLLHTQPGSIFKCNICGKQLSTQQSFRSHILLHLPDNERPFQCSQCDRGFATKPDLTLHERQHLPEDERLTCTCDICGSRFGYESGLLLHKQRVHGNNRPYLCDLCAKSFKSRCDMERHKAQTHGEVKREQCQECGKWFKGKSILKTHMRQHSGAHFPCEHCDKTYSVRSSWKAHQLTHSTEKTHICPVCNKAFKLPGTLKMHLNQHTGEHPYSCPFCPKTFASSGNYYTHRKRMHPEEVALLKKNHEAALAANGLPPPPPGPPVVPQSLSEAIEQTKQKVAAQGITIPIVDENITSLNADVLSNDIEDSDVVTPSATILTEKSVLTNAVIMSSGSVPDVNFLVANGLRIVRIISPEGTTKYSLGRKGEDTLNLAQSQLSLGPQLIQVDSGITQENNDPEESGMPFSVL